MMNNSSKFQHIADLLSQLGVTANYAGFYHVCSAVSICVKSPEWLRLVTKWLYPEIAKEHNTTSKCVERNIRTVVNLSWKRNPKLLCRIARYPLSSKPGNAEFLAILTSYITSENCL